MESRVEECIVMLPTGNRKGSVKMLNLATMKIVSRDNFKIQPMPESVIRTLNGVASKEGRSLNKQNDVFTEMQYMYSVDSFTLSFLGMSMLILCCVSRMNYQPSRSRPGGSSPREIFTGRRADGTRDFRAAFGDYALCTRPTTNNSMESRVEECIVMLPTGNRTGSVKMLNLATMKIISRDNFKIL